MASESGSRSRENCGDLEKDTKSNENISVFFNIFIYFEISINLLATLYGRDLVEENTFSDLKHFSLSDLFLALYFIKDRLCKFCMFLRIIYPLIVLTKVNKTVSINLRPETSYFRQQ